MAEVSVPRYLIAQKCLWGGWRQPPKPEIPKPPKPTYSAKPSVKITEVASLMLNGFALWEYRFWAAALSLDERSVTAECRGCQAVFSNEKARKAHIGDVGCAKRLTEAFKLLLKDKMCVICNMRSYQEKWGVPLCSPACVEAWCKVESQPDALKLALGLVGDVP